MIRCHGCNAPLPPGVFQCPYCGVSNDRDLVGVHYYTVHRPGEERTCPVCQISMETLDLGKEGAPFYIERCTACMGLFFDPGELDALIEGTEKHVYTIDTLQLRAVRDSRPPESEVLYKPCPICAKLMNRRVFGDRSGVIIDQCREHGIWLDGGELGMILRWIRAGGNLLAQQVKEQDESAQRRLELQKYRERLEEERRSKNQGQWTGGSLDDSPSDLLWEALGQLYSKFFK